MNTISKGLPYPSAIAVVLTLLVLTVSSAQAANNNTWSASAPDANWEETYNWSNPAIPYPGSTPTTNNQDIATFLNSITTSVLINSVAGNSSPLNIKGITFGATSTNLSAFTIGTTGGNELLLTTAGAITFAADTTPTNTAETINAPIVIGTGTTAQTYSFTNSNAASSNILVFGGAISGGTTGLTTLTLNGVNTGANAINGVISNGSGTFALSESAGNWTLGGANTYTGGTTISGGSILNISADNNLGSAPGSPTAGNIVISGGTLATSASFALNSNRGITLGAATGGSNTVKVASSTALTYNGIIAGTGTLVVSGGGTFVLSGVNTYTGATTINAGSTFSTGATGYIGANLTPGMLGASGYQVQNLVINGGTFQDVNTSSQEMYTQHGFTVTTLGGTIDASGAAPIYFYSSAGYAASGIGTHTLTLTGANTGENTLAAAIVDGTGVSAGASSVIKNGVGTWALIGASTYTGSTTINSGTLVAETGTALGVGTASTNNVTVAQGAGLEYFAGPVANPGIAAPLKIGGSLTITGGTGTVLGGSIGSTVTADEINVAGAATGSGALTVNVFGVSGISTNGTIVAGTNTYTLLAGGAGSALAFSSTNLGMVYNNTNFFVNSVSSSSTTVTASITSQTALTNAYWVGGLTGAANVWAASNGSTLSNWASTSNGSTTQGLTPGATTNVFISTTGTIAHAPTDTVLGTNMTIKSLTIGDAVNGLNLLADGNTLIIGSGGITINSGVPSVTIGANVTLNASQTWTNNSTGLFTVSSTVGGSGNLTIAGTGNTTLSGLTNTTHGVITMSGSGILTFSGTNANLNDGLTTVNSGELDLAKTGVAAIIGALTVGTGTGTNASVKLLGSNQIVMDGFNSGGAYYAGLSLNSDGQFALNGFNATVISLTSTGGTITSSAPGGILTVAGTTPTVAFTGTNATSTIGAGATVAGTAQATLAASDTLVVNGTLANTGGVSLAASTTAAPTTLRGTGSVSGTVVLNGGTGLNSNVISSTGTLTTGGITVNGTGNSISSGTVVGPVGINGSSSLAVNGTVASAVTLGDGSANAAVLSGTGIVSGLVTAHGASGASLIMPATTSSIGNLTLNGGVKSLTGLTLSFAIDGAGATNSLLTLGSTGLSVTGGLTFNLYDLGTNTLTTDTAYTLIMGTGALSADSISVNLLNSGYTLNTSYGTGGVLFSGNIATFEVVAVPEPSTWALMFGSLALLIVMQQRKRKRD